MLFFLLASVALATEYQKNKNENIVGYTYDEDMSKLHPHPKFNEETSNRIKAIYDFLQATPVFKYLKKIEIEKVSDEEICYVHENEHLQSLKKECNDMMDTDDHRFVDPDTYYTKGTYQAARLNCSSVVSLVRAIFRGEIQRGLAICRPPGHHCGINKRCGFCHLNNVSVAAEVAIRNYKLKRVVILDWDAHHGNGTQDIFYERNDVLYISMHRYGEIKKDEQFFPGKFLDKDGNPYGSEKQVGEGVGKGYNINIPLPCDNLGNYHYIIAFEKVVIPILEQFKPELILISAGFDSARGDPIGRMDVTKKGYEYMTSKLMQYAPVVLALEGGYNVDKIPELFHACAEVLVFDKQISGENVKKTKGSGGKRKRQTEQFMESLYKTMVHPVLNEVWNLKPDEPNLSEELGEKLKLNEDEKLNMSPNESKVDKVRKNFSQFHTEEKYSSDRRIVRSASKPQSAKLNDVSKEIKSDWGVSHMNWRFFKNIETQEFYAENVTGRRAKDEKGWTALHHAVDRANIKIARAVIHAGVDIDAQDECGWTALQIATNSNQLAIVEMLIHEGAKTEQTIYGLTALHIAAIRNNLEIVKMLIEAPAHADVDVEVPDSLDTCWSLPGLMCSIGGGSLNRLNNFTGLTALHIAATLNHLEIGRTIIEAGAGLDKKCDTKTALDVCNEMNHGEFAKMLCKKENFTENPNENNPNLVSFAKFKKSY